MSSVRAELLILTRKPSVWILLGIGVVLNLFVSYIAPYVTYSGSANQGSDSASLRPMLPEAVIGNVLEGFPFYVAMFGLILGAITLGSEFTGGTLKTTLMQHPSRVRLLVSKLIGIGLILLVFLAGIALSSVVFATIITVLEGVSPAWPATRDLLLAFIAGWLILTTWAMFGSMLAVVTRGTSMAIGLGILYGLVFEGLVSGFGADIGLLRDLSYGFLRANGYSLIEPLGATAPAGGEPGAFPGPFVSAWIAALVLSVYVLGFTTISAIVLRYREVA